MKYLNAYKYMKKKDSKKELLDGLDTGLYFYFTITAVIINVSRYLTQLKKQ